VADTVAAAEDADGEAADMIKNAEDTDVRMPRTPIYKACRGCRCKGRRYKGCRECRGRELKAALIWNAGMRKSWCELAGKKYGKLTSAKIYGYRNGKAGVKGANGVHTLAYKDVTASALSTDS